MDQNEAANKAWEFLDSQRLVFKGFKQTYLQIFNQLYAIGYDEGNRVRCNKKTVIQMDRFGNVIEEFESIASAHRKTKVDNTGIVNCCKGKQNNAGGFYWRYKE